MLDRTIALAIEARITQVIHTISANVPKGAIGKGLWDATSPLRKRFPVLQDGLTSQSHIPFVSIDREQVAHARTEGFHIPPFDPRTAFRKDVPPPIEGARLVGIVERAHLADIDTLFLDWANGADSPGRRAAFGANLVDQVLGIKPSPTRLPVADLNHPAMVMDMVRPFAKAGGDFLMESVADLDEVDADLAAARVLGHYEAANGATGQELMERSGFDPLAFTETLMDAAMGGCLPPKGIEAVQVPNLPRGAGLGLRAV